MVSVQDLGFDYGDRPFAIFANRRQRSRCIVENGAGKSTT